MAWKIFGNKEKNLTFEAENKTVYVVNDYDLEKILEAIRDVNSWANKYASYSSLKRYDRYDVDCADYLQGIADTMKDGERLRLIAGLFSAIKPVFAVNVNEEGDL